MPSNLHEVPGPDTGGMAAPIARFASPDGKANLSVNALGIHDSIQNHYHNYIQALTDEGAKRNIQSTKKRRVRSLWNHVAGKRILCQIP